MYSIRGLCHRTDINFGQHGFIIELSPEWKEAVARSKMTDAMVNALIQNCGRQWLDAAGYDDIFDPDNCGFHKDPKLPPGPRARPLYEPNNALRVSWGEWGPEHISVPGNACGLDLEKNYALLYPEGVQLLPHNVDSLSQKYLLLIVFTEIADTVLLRNRCKETT